MSEPTLLLRFSTKLNGYQIPTTTYSLPQSSTRLSLSRLVNHILSLPNPIPFDFIISGDFLRTSLIDHVKTKDVPTENVIEVEYTLALPAPKQEWSHQLDNWITCLSYCQQKLFCGLSNDMINVCNNDGILTSQHGKLSTTATRPIKSISTSYNNEQLQVLIAGKSNSINLFDYSSQLTHIRSYIGHTASIESLCFSPSSNQFVSGSWDKTIRIWQIEQQTTSTQTSSKKNLELSGHSQAITHVLWPVEHQIISASLDNNVSIWDVDQSALISAYKVSKTVSSIDYSVNNSLIASGHNDAIERLTDPRSQTVAMKLLKSHKNIIMASAWHPHSAYLLATGSYDNSVKIWDIRSVTPLCTLPFESKITSVCWNDVGDVLFCGGANGMLRSHKITH
ncbi:Ribosome biogenesis protein WDR12-like protein [Entamoeba marina]